MKEGRLQILLGKPLPFRESWGVPKGHVDEGETHEDCARRETLEEVGVKVLLESPLPPFEVSSKDELKTVYLWLAQQIDDTEPFPADGENVDVKYFDVDKLPTTHVTQRATIFEAIEVIKAKMEPTSA